MYSMGGGVANGGRIYNPRPDPSEVGPPRRVNREESHIGEMVASSKRRVSWTFTLGDGDTVHEVVLVHSIMSYKKVVEFDGRQMHFSATATPGDWSYSMFLDGTNYVIEVRINDLESADVPKYDLVIDRVPFRRWDVYRRKKLGQASTSAYGQPAGYSTPHAPAQQQQAPGGGSFGAHRWGPSGMTAPPPMGPSPSRHASTTRNSFGHSSSYLSPAPPPHQPPPQQQQQQFNGHFQTHYNSAAPRSQAPAPASQPRPQRQEIDLLGDFGGANVTTVTAQQLIFDPLAGTKLGGGPSTPSATSQPGRTASSPSMGAPAFGAMQQQAQPNARTSSNPSMAYNTMPQPFDPFASANQPLSMKPAATSVNLDPLATQNSAYMQASRAPPAAPAYSAFQGGQPAAMAPRGVPIASLPMQQAATGYPVAMGGAFPPKTNGVNYNISHLMNPMEVNNVRNAQQTKNIDIDPFAGLKTK